MYEIDYSLAWKLEKWKQTIFAAMPDSVGQ